MKNALFRLSNTKKAILAIIIAITIILFLKERDIELRVEGQYLRIPKDEIAYVSPSNWRSEKQATEIHLKGVILNEYKASGVNNIYYMHISTSHNIGDICEFIRNSIYNKDDVVNILNEKFSDQSAYQGYLNESTLYEYYVYKSSDVMCEVTNCPGPNMVEGTIVGTEVPVCSAYVLVDPIGLKIDYPRLFVKDWPILRSTFIDRLNAMKIER